MAYCLMGIFDVNMPLLYGEGGARAFLRLQEEILRSNEDYTIFVWVSDNQTGSAGIFAPSVSCFRSFYSSNYGLRSRLVKLSQIQPADDYIAEKHGVVDTEPPLLTSQGLRMTLHARSSFNSFNASHILEVFLNCITETQTQEQGLNSGYELLCLKSLFSCDS